MKRAPQPAQIDHYRPIGLAALAAALSIRPRRVSSVLVRR